MTGAVNRPLQTKRPICGGRMTEAVNRPLQTKLPICGGRMTEAVNRPIQSQRLYSLSDRQPRANPR